MARSSATTTKSALSQLLVITLVLPIDEACDFIIMRRAQAHAHMRLSPLPASSPRGI